MHDSTSSDEDNENLLEKIEELTNLKKRMSAQAKDLIRKLIKNQFFSWHGKYIYMASASFCLYCPYRGENHNKDNILNDMS